MRRRFVSLIAAAAALALILAACGGSDDNGGGGGTSGGKTPKIGVILPDTKSSARWETADKPLLTEASRPPESSTTSRTPRATRPSSRRSPTR
jgi:D-xylose transport system substrate-binding protein